MLRIVEFPASDDKLKELHGFLCDKAKAAVKSRQNQIDGNYTRWQDNYNAKPYQKVRSTPFYRAANFVPQLIRMHTDILHARTWGICIGTRPFWKPKMLPEGPHEMLDYLGQTMETWSQNAGLYSCLDSALLRSYKSGVCVVKGPWVEDEYYLGVGTEGKDSVTKVTKEGVQFRPLPFDDFFPYPITANSLKEVTISFHRIRLAKEEVEYRMHRGWWNEEAGKLLLAGGSAATTNEPGRTARESNANEAGIVLSQDVGRPFTAFEAWYDYELQNGKMFKLVTTFNPFTSDSTKTGILRRHYNYYPKGETPFVDLRPMPREDLFYGYNIPEMLEQAQEEQAQIHNGRRDSNSMCVPGWKKKRYADVPNPSTEWYPGKVFELEDMGDLEILNPDPKYNAMIDEERHLMSLAETYTGAGQPLQAAGSGIMSGKRGIYNSGGTLALLAEGNRRLDIYIKRMRGEVNSPTGFHGLGNLLYQSNKAFRPDGLEYQIAGDKGQAIKKSFELNESEGYNGLFFEIGASDAGANRETERTGLLLMANTMAAYYKEVVEVAGMVGQLPDKAPIKEVMLTVLDGARDLANRLLFAFDVPDRKRLVPDIRKLLGGVAEGAPGQSQPPGGAQPGAMPTPEGPVSESSLQDLSTHLAAITGGSNGAPGAGVGAR